MKNNFKFFCIVLVLLLTSSIVLAGCMYAIAAENGAAKVYDMGSQINTNNTIADDDTPMTQEELQMQFSEMYDISEDGKTITVISREYLNDYWQSNYEKEVIKSLSAEEVYFIIQDSIRIYEEYDEVVLTGFASVSSAEVVERFPFIEDKIIKTHPDTTPYYKWDDTDAIYEIILYRLKALSSPKTFFTGEEAIHYVGGDPSITSTMLPWTTFYIPDCSKNTDRDYILSVVGNSLESNSDAVDADKYSDLFSFCNKYGASISFESKSNGLSTKVYPTVELDNKTKPYFSIKLPELNNAILEHRQDYKLYLDGELLIGGGFEDFVNLCLYDITGDGIPELCFVMSTGSGVIDHSIVIKDYQTKKCIFSLSDRFGHDYELFFRDESLCVLEIEYRSTELTRTGVLTYDGTNISVSWDAEINYPYDLPTGIPIEKWNEMQ